MQTCRAPFPRVVVVADIVAKALKLHFANLEVLMIEDEQRNVFKDEEKIIEKKSVNGVSIDPLKVFQ